MRAAGEAIHALLETTRCLHHGQQACRYALYWRDLDLIQRVFQHREGTLLSFTSRYDCKLLVWYEMHETMESAILREKQIKGGSRKAKLALVQGINPGWRDLFDGLL